LSRAERSESYEFRKRKAETNKQRSSDFQDLMLLKMGTNGFLLNMKMKL